ncbi:MAG: hypothetical protein ACI8PZ_004733 [Myxococcota bacterium]|jgi:hypothetical protein
MLLLALLACTPETLTRTVTEQVTVTAEVVLPVDRDNDGHSAVADGGTDCDDANAAIFPGAPELCNGVDDDCDGVADEPFDVDRDGVLTAAEPACAALGIQLDCDDADPTVYPGAPDDCDGVDQDCDGLDGTGSDGDGDGVPTCDDCDDADPRVFPGAVERCNGIDDDCSGLADEPFDADGDGWGACAGDCDDADPRIHPDAVEVCDTLDNDCSGEADEPFDADLDGWSTCRGDCDDFDPSVHPFAADICDGVDNDCDGWPDSAYDQDRDGVSSCDAEPDCDDAEPDVYPGAPEVCDGLDDDCDGVVPPDEVDADADGVRLCDGDCDDEDPRRTPGRPEACDGVDSDCDPGTDEAVDGDSDGFAACEGDCDDLDPDVWPGAFERCNGVDDDCDGVVDNGADCGGCTPELWNGSAYLYCPFSVTWEVARGECLALGYDLWTLDDAEEADHVRAATSPLDGGAWWTGLNDLDAEGMWVWADGSDSLYRDWAPGEPNDSGGEDCMHAFWSGMQWNDIQCNATEPYVCEVR